LLFAAGHHGVDAAFRLRRRLCRPVIAARNQAYESAERSR
jgi:hypothetical protein